MSCAAAILLANQSFAKTTQSVESTLISSTQTQQTTLQSAQQQLRILQQKNQLTQQRLTRLRARQQQQTTLKPTDITKAMVDRAKLDVALAEANIDGAGISLSEAQQANEATMIKIATLEKQLQTATLAAGKTNTTKQEISVLQSELNHQKELFKLQQKQLNELTTLQLTAKQTKDVLQNYKYTLDHLYHLNLQQEQQKALQKEELQLEQQQQFWLTRLSVLSQQVQNLENLNASKEDKQKLELQILQAQEQGNLMHLRIVLLHLKEQIANLEQQQTTSVVSLNNLMTRMDAILLECDNLNALVKRKLDFLSVRENLEQKSFEQGLLSKEAYKQDVLILTDLINLYKNQIKVINSVRQQTTNYQVSVQKQLNRALARRQGLPGFSVNEWKTFSQQLVKMPMLATQTLIALKDQIILAYDKLSLKWVIAIALLEVLWLSLWLVLRKGLRKLLVTLERKRNDIADNMLFIIFTLLERNFVWVFIILALLFLLFLFGVTTKSFAPLMAVILVWFIFKMAIDLARILLLDTPPDVSGRDVKLYIELKYGLILGGVLTMLTVLAHELPIGYQVTDFFNRLFMLFMLIISIVLLRGWKVVPALVETHVELARPYLMRVITLLSFLVPLTIFSTALIGFFGYVDFAWSISRYEGLFLLVLSGYILVRGFWNDLIEWSSEFCIRHLHHGWLWSQEFLKPLNSLVQVILFLGIFAALFHLYGLSSQSYIVALINKILHFNLLQVKTQVLTPLALIKFIFAGIVIYWLSRWSRELAFRWLFAKSQDLGVRNSLAAFTQYTVVVMGVMIALQIIGIDLTGISYVFGGLAFGAAFGLRDLVKNYASGLLLLIERPVRAGDLVSIGDYEGEVSHIGMRSMTVKTWDHMEVVVPNSETFDKPFTNWTRLDSILRTVINLKFSRTDDPIKIKALIESVLKSNAYIVSDPEPQIYFMEMDDALMAFEVRYFINLQQGKTRPAIRSEVLFALFELFKQHNIKPPHPPQDVYFYPASESPT